MSPEDDLKSPPGILASAIKAVPAVKYALGVGGILAVIAIAVGFGTDLRSLVFGSVIMFVLMTLLVIFASLSGQTTASFRIPAIILAWFSLLLMMATAVSLFSSLFVGWPLDLRRVLGQLTDKTVVSQPVGDSANKLPQTTPGVSAGPVTTSQSGQQEVSSKPEDSDADNTSKIRSNPDQHQYPAKKQTPTNKVQSETADFDPPIDGNNLAIEKEGDEHLRLAIGNQACLEMNCQDFSDREKYAQSVVDLLIQARTKWKAALTERGSDHTVSRIKAKLLSAQFECRFEAPCIATEANASHLSWYYQSSPKEVVGHLP